MHRRLRRLRLLAASYLRVFLDNPHVGLVASNKYVCINACLNLPQRHNLAWQPCDDSCAHAVFKMAAFSNVPIVVM